MTPTSVPQITELSNGELNQIVNTHKFNGLPVVAEMITMAVEILKERGEPATVRDVSIHEPVPDPISSDAYYIAKCAREDAREASGRIVKHMWIILVCLPVVLGILLTILK
jgi:hypothetical protein